MGGGVSPHAAFRDAGGASKERGEKKSRGSFKGVKQKQTTLARSRGHLKVSEEKRQMMTALGEKGMKRLGHSVLRPDGSGDKLVEGVLEKAR